MQRIKKRRPSKKRDIKPEDYWAKLSPEDREFLYKFNREYYLADGIYKEDAIHSTPEMREQVAEDRDRAEREVDLTNADPAKAASGQTEDYMDELIELLDSKKKS